MGSFTHCIRHINRCARAYQEERLGPLGLHGGQAEHGSRSRRDI